MQAGGYRFDPGCLHHVPLATAISSCRSGCALNPRSKATSGSGLRPAPERSEWCRVHGTAISQVVHALYRSKNEVFATGIGQLNHSPLLGSGLVHSKRSGFAPNPRSETTSGSGYMAQPDNSTRSDIYTFNDLSGL